MARLTNLQTALPTLGSRLGFSPDADGHSPVTEPWRRWYKLARWSKTRADQLQAQPLCEFCLRDGMITAATVCDHTEPHRGDSVKFWAGPFQSLCKPHHDGEKQRSEGKRWGGHR